MTPRLRNLLIGLGISVAIMIVDQASKSSGSSNSNSSRKAKIQKPKKVVAQNSTSKVAASIPSNNFGGLFNFKSEILKSITCFV